MKTIEEAAFEYAVKQNGIEDEWAPDRMASRADFKAGVEFAQRWIHVDEELPEEQGYYLVITPHSFPKNCKVMVAEFYDDNLKFYSESDDSCLNDVTHWRPIEVK